VITPADLLSPVGPLEPGFLPDTPTDPLVDRLQIYITEGELKVLSYPIVVEEPDSAVKAWALYRAFDAAYLLKSNRPASSSMQDLGSQSFTEGQIKAFQDKALDYLQAFHLIIPETASVQSDRFTGTIAVPKTRHW